MIKQQKTIFYLSIIWIFVILLMGGWWLYLMNYLSQQLISRGVEAPDIIRLTKWEGSTFLILILLVTSTIYYYYYRIIQKNQAMQGFFASLTHELKTPLASIRLQGEVISEMALGGKVEQLPKLCKRLTQDTNSLETQMDKVLQLSQLERGRKLNTQEVDLSSYFSKKLLSEEIAGGAVSISFENKIEDPEASLALVDVFALNLILRNLIENTKRHSDSNEAKIVLEKTPDKSRDQSSEFVQVTYSDGGKFQGDQEHIAELFAKGSKSKGSGIGLYLIDQLTIAMNGHTKFNFVPTYSVTLSFLAANTEGKES
jgi:signal transduction histidine kinase